MKLSINKQQQTHPTVSQASSRKGANSVAEIPFSRTRSQRQQKQLMSPQTRLILKSKTSFLFQDQLVFIKQKKSKIKYWINKIVERLMKSICFKSMKA